MLEFDLIEKFFKPLTKIPTISSGQHPSLNLENDIAFFQKNIKNLVISKDVFVENVHFLKSDGAYKIASKLLLTNLSDIASSGAIPRHYMLGFSKNSSLDKNFYSKFVEALSDLQKQYGISLIGGDTISSPQLFFSVTIFGELPNKKPLLRTNAKDGDLIFVTNSIGDASLGLDIKLNRLCNPNKKLQNFEKFLLDKHFFPQPRIAFTQELLKNNLSNCATDISDGLIKDLSNICKASKLNAEIYLSQIPFSFQAKKYLQDNPKITNLDLISSGDDYEIIFSTSPKNLAKIDELSKKLDLNVYNIGEFRKKITRFKNYKNSNYEVLLFPNKNLNNETDIIKTKKTGYEH